MTDNVSRLKELLFDSENQTLADLSRRLEAAQNDRAALGERIDAVFKRSGTDERFRKSIAGALDGALRDAEVERHGPLSEAMAPLIVGTVKTEIHNSRDEIAEALYPMTGRMVKAYVASAMKDLAEQINRKLDQNPLILRLKSIATGRPIGELALADAQRIEVDELYLIRRGSGELVARWPANDNAADRDQVMGGILSAINDFASEALKDEGSSLREIDLGDRQVYLRASPVYLLAAKCSGSATAAMEKILDDHFLSTIGRLQSLGNDSDREASTPRNESSGLLARLADDLENDLSEKQGELASAAHQFSPLKALAWIILTPLVAWVCWLVYSNYQTARVHSLAQQVVISSSDLKGYPIGLQVSPLGRRVMISGLVPSGDTKVSVVNKLRTALPETEISADYLAVVPSGGQGSEEVERLRKMINTFEPAIETLKQDAAAVAEQLLAIKKQLGARSPTVANSRQKLEAFARRHAVFFSAGSKYRQRQQTRRVLDELAGLIKRSKALVRIVGYTDERGTSNRNTPLSQSRADKVRSDLLKRGVKKSRLIAVGRRDVRDISGVVGSKSPNRRVEFEIGFENEVR